MPTVGDGIVRFSAFFSQFSFGEIDMTERKCSSQEPQKKLNQTLPQHASLPRYIPEYMPDYV